jgi:hypothetical protein
MYTAIFFLGLLSSILALAQQPGANTVRLAIPGVKGVLEINVGPTDSQMRVRGDGIETQMRAMNRPDHLLISAFLQKVRFAASPESCRAEWWPGTMKSVPIKRDELRESMKDGIARVEFVVQEFAGNAIRQKNIHAYLGARDLCAEIHLSEAAFAADDQKLFEEVLASVRLLPEEEGARAQAPSGDSLDYFRQGSRLYLQQNYAAAAVPYQKALELEKRHRTLDRNFFLVLVDNLGMSYGMSGNLARAKETFEYGLSQEPEYPLFYYNVACVYGEMGKMEESLEELRLAYKYRANMIRGETFPDPLKDDSFRNFVREKKFTDAVRQMQQQ